MKCVSISSNYDGSGWNKNTKAIHLQSKPNAKTISLHHTKSVLVTTVDGFLIADHASFASTKKTHYVENRLDFAEEVTITYYR